CWRASTSLLTEIKSIVPTPAATRPPAPTRSGGTLDGGWRSTGAGAGVAVGAGGVGVGAGGGGVGGVGVGVGAGFFLAHFSLSAIRASILARFADGSARRYALYDCSASLQSPLSLCACAMLNSSAGVLDKRYARLNSSMALSYSPTL